MEVSTQEKATKTFTLRGIDLIVPMEERVIIVTAGCVSVESSVDRFDGTRKSQVTFTFQCHRFTEEGVIEQRVRKAGYGLLVKIAANGLKDSLAFLSSLGALHPKIEKEISYIRLRATTL